LERDADASDPDEMLMDDEGIPGEEDDDLNYA